jgi:hypothetical protein
MAPASKFDASWIRCCVHKGMFVGMFGDKYFEVGKEKQSYICAVSN